MQRKELQAYCWHHSSQIQATAVYLGVNPPVPEVTSSAAFICTWAQDERPADLHMAQPNVHAAFMSILPLIA
jgi:hypothetical protein